MEINSKLDIGHSEVLEDFRTMGGNLDNWELLSFDLYFLSLGGESVRDQPFTCCRLDAFSSFSVVFRVSVQIYVSIG
jgi:hypothetical protein